MLQNAECVFLGRRKQLFLPMKWKRTIKNIFLLTNTLYWIECQCLQYKLYKLPICLWSKSFILYNCLDEMSSFPINEYMLMYSKRIELGVRFVRAVSPLYFVKPFGWSIKFNNMCNRTPKEDSWVFDLPMQ